MTPLDAVRRDVFARHHAEWLVNAQTIRRQPSVKAVHDMRVAGRKLRAAIRLFKNTLPASTAAIDHGLVDMGALLGAARDLDVHLLYIKNLRKTWSPPACRGLRPYQVELHRQLHQARGAIQQGLKSPAFQRLNEAIEALWEDSSEGSRRSAAKAAKKLLRKKYHKLKKRSHRLATDPSDLRLHRFRRAVRRMRYTAQFFESTAKPPLQKLASCLGEWQDLLGDRQDRLVGGRLVSEYLAERKKAVPLAVERALLRLVRQLDREKETLQEQILFRWTPSDRRKLKHLLEKAF